jgi:hypothetical protein
MAFAGPSEDGRAEAEAMILQRREVDAVDDDVAAKLLRHDVVQPEMAGDRGKMFALDQRDLPRTTSTAIAIADEAFRSTGHGRLDAGHRRAPCRSQPEPDDAPGPDRCVQQRGEERPRPAAARRQAITFASTSFSPPSRSSQAGTGRFFERRKAGLKSLDCSACRSRRGSSRWCGPGPSRGRA